MWQFYLKFNIYLCNFADIRVVQAAGLMLEDYLNITITVLHINHAPKFATNAGTFFVKEQLVSKLSSLRAAHQYQ